MPEIGRDDVARPHSSALAVMPNCARDTLQIKTVKVYGPNYVHRLHLGSRPLYECTPDEASEANQNGSAMRISKYVIRLRRLSQAAVSADFRGYSCQMGPRAMEWMISSEDAAMLMAMFHRVRCLERTA